MRSSLNLLWYLLKISVMQFDQILKSLTIHALSWFYQQLIVLSALPSSPSENAYVLCISSKGVVIAIMTVIILCVCVCDNKKWGHWDVQCHFVKKIDSSPMPIWGKQIWHVDGRASFEIAAHEIIHLGNKPLRRAWLFYYSWHLSFYLNVLRS